MIRTVTTFLFSFSFLVSFGQEKVYDLQYNSKLYYSQQKSIAAKRALDTLSLPFIDDFSYNSMYPDPARWVDSRSVYVNDNYPTNKLSYGVATFDGLNEHGLPHNNNGMTTYGSADTLTSQPIDLQGLTDTNLVFLSFAYEPKGLGDKPEAADSFILEFKILDTVWQQVWAIPGSDSTITDPHFTKVLVPVNNAFYFDQGFQFRFRNLATITGNNDNWHLDYVYLNKTRGPNDTIIRDVTVLNPVTNFLKNYTSMPWSHFKDNQTTEVDSQLVVSYRNNTSSPRNMKFTYEVRGNFSQSLLFDSTLTLSPFPPVSNYDTNFSVLDFVPIPFSPINEDSVEVILKSYCDFFTTDITIENDTVYNDVHFENYFAYDDGTAERAYGLEGPGLKKFAYEFNINHPDTLRALQFQFSQINENLSLRELTLVVWNTIAPTEDTLYYHERTPFHYIDERNGFTVYVLDSPIVVQNKFYVGWQQLFPENIQLGFDLNDTATQHMFYYSNGSWKASQEKGSPMIRPVVGKNVPLIGTGIKNIFSEMSAFIYPNPTERFINIKLSGVAKRMDFYDMQGRVVKSIAGSSQQIDIGDLNKGLYVLRIFSEKNAPQSLRFVKL